MRIAIVEDHAELREMFVMGLELLDHDVESYQNAVEASRALLDAKLNRRELPDIVLVDLNLPGGIDGAEMICRLREEIAPRETAFVLMSNNSLADRRLKEKHLFDIPFWPKESFTPRQMKARLDTLLRQRERDEEQSA